MPTIRCSGHQHRAGLGAQLAVLLKRMRDRTGTANHLDTKNRILVDIRGGREPSAGLPDAIAALAVVAKIYTDSGYDHRA